MTNDYSDKNSVKRVQISGLCLIRIYILTGYNNI